MSKSGHTCEFGSQCSLSIVSDNPYTTIEIYFLKLTDDPFAKADTPQLKRDAADGLIYDVSGSQPLRDSALYVTSNLTLGDFYYVPSLDTGITRGLYAIFAVVAGDAGESLRYSSTQVSWQSYRPPFLV